MRGPPEHVLATLVAATKGRVKPGKLLQLVGSVLLVDSIGIRDAEPPLQPAGGGSATNGT
jgi:hypothetical protein